jgi:hypothetical protein
MPETPDFDQIATRWIAEWRTGKGLGEVTLETLVAEQLRLVWNARGAADLAKIDLEFADDTLTLKSLDRALRSLDR